ncbi:hypothetical protein SFB97_12030 [Enterococcus hirae]|uniref:hypothetical protein n=1 Tax=Enterococcus hirae TaxID=1354 RepID=UPI00391DDB1A
MSEKNLSSTEKKAELLALFLGLKDSNVFHSSGPDAKEFYQLLFSNYQKMILKDSDNFFVAKEHKASVIESLQHTIDFYETQMVTDIVHLLERLKSDNYTSFIITSANFLTEGEGTKHSVGLLIHKKKDYYTVAILDKGGYYNERQGSYVKIPKSKLQLLSQVLLDNKSTNKTVGSHNKMQNYGILNAIVELSNNDDISYVSPKASDLKIKVKKQMVGNCIFAGVNLAFKTALFCCHTDVYKDIDHRKNNISIKPMEKIEASYETNQRFLNVLKGNDINENKVLDIIYSYYEERKHAKMSLPKINKKWKTSKNPFLRIKYHIRKWQIQQKQEIIYAHITKEIMQDPYLNLNKKKIESIKATQPAKTMSNEASLQNNYWTRDR